ncbi:hypothetical protein CEXT_663151 [Caerostris extrusa]|uniref:Uncharacterized protein n=1 Tax=Caerostris extrusa TaxID=172846 RepID=A0AAV4SHW1_CAEEX|nr:hypothetical protein CEXT_663151 [Caerostris extrusa]
MLDYDVLLSSWESKICQCIVLPSWPEKCFDRSTQETTNGKNCQIYFNSNSHLKKERFRIRNPTTTRFQNSYNPTAFVYCFDMLDYDVVLSSRESKICQCIVLPSWPEKCFDRSTQRDDKWKELSNM